MPQNFYKNFFRKTPIQKQSWELNHDDIECTKKIGEGAFGEVSLGRLTTKGKVTH